MNPISQVLALLGCERATLEAAVRSNADEVIFPSGAVMVRDGRAKWHYLIVMPSGAVYQTMIQPTEVN